jgi:hypothetical protein
VNRRTLISGIGLIVLKQTAVCANAVRLAFTPNEDDSDTAIVDSNEISLNKNERKGVNAFRLDLLPFLRNGVQTHQFCSYDRAGDNYDFDYFPLYMEPDGEGVIFNAFGPGV